MASVAALVVAVMVVGMSPVSAAFTPTKGAIKKIAKKVAKKVAKKQINAMVPGIATGIATGIANTAAANAAAGVGSRVGYFLDVAGLVPSATQSIGQVSVTAPAPGFLVIHAGNDTFNYVGPEFGICWVNVDGTDLESSVRWIQLDFDSSDSFGDTSDVNAEENCDTETVVPVNTGPHTVQYWYDSFFYDTNIDNVVLSATWVPFNGVGGKPTSFGLLAPDRSPGDSSFDIRGLAKERGIRLPTRG